MIQIDSSLTYERLVNISVSLALQNALVNEIYPEMRSVVGCISHEQKRVVVLVIHDGEISLECGEALEDILNEIIIEAPIEYECSLQIERLDHPSLYELKAPGWYCFVAYLPHMFIDVSTANLVSIAIGGP